MAAVASFPKSKDFETVRVSVQDFEDEAKKQLPVKTLGYYTAGATAETTLRENVDAFSRWYILPRMLRDASVVSTATSILGHPVSMPIGIAPTAMQRMAHEKGEEASVRAASRHQICYTLSTLSTTSMEDVATADVYNTPKFFQLYIYKDRSVTTSLVRRAEAAGYAAIVLTVDAAVFGVRRNDVRNKFTMPSHLTLANFNIGTDDNLTNNTSGGSGINDYVTSMFDSSISWQDLKWLVSTTRLPVVAKGILTPQDATLAIECGVSAIWVSNHGARQVDAVPPTIEALPHIVSAVGDSVPVYVDGGFREATDIFKALAMGATMVFLGRPILWGLTVGGEDGVNQLLSVLREDLLNVMANTGKICSMSWLTQICYSDFESGQLICEQVDAEDKPNGNYTVSGLTACTSYPFIIQGISPGGLNGSISVNTTETLDVRPGPVRNLAVSTRSTTSLGVDWDIPLENSECIDQYVISYTNTEEVTTTTKVVSNLNSRADYEDILTGLDPCVNYLVTVYAVSIGGKDGSAVSTTGATDDEVPSVPRNLQTVTSTKDSATFLWYAPAERFCVEQYHMRFMDVSGNTVDVNLNYEGPDTHAEQYIYTFQSDDLVACTTYDLQLDAHNAAGNISPDAFGQVTMAC